MKEARTVNKWKDSPCFQIRRNKTVKISKSPSVLLIQCTIKILMTFLTKTEENNANRESQKTPNQI